MKVRPVIGALIAFVALVAGAEGGASLLKNGDFQQFSSGGRVPRWQYSARFWHAVEGVGVKGSRALVYDNPSAAPAGCPWQRFEIAAGKRYVLEGGVRIEGALTGAEGTGAFLRAQWEDKEKRRLGEIVAGSVSSTGDTWLHLCVTSTPVAAGAVSGKVEFGVTPGGAGRVAFDNVRFSRWLPVRLQALECTGNGHRARDGSVTFTARLDLTGENVAAWKGRFHWRGADGRVHVTEASSMDAATASMTLAVRDMAFGSSSVGFVLLKPDGQIAGRRELVFNRPAP